MYKVLIVDDNIDKINTILNSFKNEIETEKIYFDYELEIKKEGIFKKIINKIKIIMQKTKS